MKLAKGTVWLLIVIVLLDIWLVHTYAVPPCGPNAGPDYGGVCHQEKAP
jgi:hypothetical protein